MKKIRMLVTMLFVVVFCIIGLTQVNAGNTSRIILPGQNDIALSNDNNYYEGNITVVENDLSENYVLLYQRVDDDGDDNTIEQPFENNWSDIKESKKIRFNRNSYTGEKSFHIFVKIADEQNSVNEIADGVYTVQGGTKVAVGGIELNVTSTDIQVGETKTLIATITPDNATIKDVEWSTDNPDVATVENGVVTAVGVGEAVITVKSVDKSSVISECAVTVIDNQGTNNNNNNEIINDNNTVNDITNNTNEWGKNESDNTITPSPVLPNAGSLTYLIIVAVVGVGVGIYFIYKKVKYYDV